jgi:hypothetical protein
MDRRDLLKAAALGPLALDASAVAAPAPTPCAPALKWKRGIENQRIADLGE